MRGCGVSPVANLVGTFAPSLPRGELAQYTIEEAALAELIGVRPFASSR